MCKEHRHIKKDCPIDKNGPTDKEIEVQQEEALRDMALLETTVQEYYNMDIELMLEKYSVEVAMLGERLSPTGGKKEIKIC